MPLIDALLSVIAPHDCLVCGAEGRIVCSWCLPDAFPELPSRCFRCKRLTSDFAVCEGCRKPTGLRHVWICTEYDGIAKQLLKRFKYERTRSAQAVLAEVMNGLLPFLPPSTLIVPVPTASSRIRQRGYDQTVLLARSISSHHSLMWAPAIAHLTQSRQVGANRKQRLSQLEFTFLVRNPKIIKNADILLVDDVATTGATIETIAHLLKAGGAKSVSALVFAQKQ